MIDFNKLSEEVTDEKSFFDFITALAADRADEIAKEKVNPSSPYGPGSNEWENITIESFLEAAADWGNASFHGLKYYQKPDNPWRRCAQILLVEKMYE
jgi:hypothetical protein